MGAASGTAESGKPRIPGLTGGSRKESGVSDTIHGDNYLENGYLKSLGAYPRLFGKASTM